MRDFQQTKIWQKNLAQQLENDKYENERNFLRVEFENFREKAKILANEISKELPQYTVHDINHIDALWDTAELIVPDNYDINPIETYVLGGAFLLHDLGMALAAYPNGIEELKKEQIWIDSVTSSLKKKLDRALTQEDIKECSPEIERDATEKTLRLLHAKKASELATISWENDNGAKVYLIDNVELREAMGYIIGLIAYSHWWSTEQLEEKLPPTIGAISRFPSEWTVDPMKLACILRASDAVQIDDRRAPSFLRTIRKPNGISDTHWIFQEKLYQPRVENNRIIFTSKTPFSVEQIDAWWVCYDTLKMIDNELRDIDALLVSKKYPSLNVIGVSSVESPKRLMRLIFVENWVPIDAQICVNNVAKLVSNIGGSQLYGENHIVPLRELIQNASDAIRARRIIENEDEIYGNIIIHFGKDEHGTYIEVEDNGIGMSEKVLTGPLLDFGQSFWSSELMHTELPGIESKGFSSTGKYGVGFFSLFMWSQKIKIITNRFDNGRKETKILEFTNGVNTRPILRNAVESECLKNGGTKVKAWVSAEIINKILKYDSEGKGKTISKLIEQLCPSMDCNICVKENEQTKTIIKANDWITIPPKKLLTRLLPKHYSKENKEYFDIMCNNLETIRDSTGLVVGRATISLARDWWYYQKHFASVTVGGFHANELNNILGIFIGKSVRASRDSGIPTIKSDELQTWANNQATKLSNEQISKEKQLKIFSIIRALGGTSNTLKVATAYSGIVNLDEIETIIRTKSIEEFIIVQDAAVQIYESDNKCKIKLLENVLLVNTGIPNILASKDGYSNLWWPEFNKKIKVHSFHDRSLEGLLFEKIAEVWECNPRELYLQSDNSSDEHSYSAIIGNDANGKPITLKSVSIIKKFK